MLSVKNLTVVYPDGTRAVDDISFTIGGEESVALIGANGAGKTSLLLSLVGVLTAKTGSITVDDIVLSKDTLNNIRRRVGYVFQNPDDQLFMPTIMEDISFGPHNFGISHEEIHQRVDRVLEQLDITRLRDRSSLKLSGGEKRMAAIASVLVMDPTLMIFDEPTAFLDPKARRKLINTLNALPHAKLIATHDLSFAVEACSRVMVIKGGRLFAEGGTELLYNEKLMDDAGVEAIQRL